MNAVRAVAIALLIASSSAMAAPSDDAPSLAGFDDAIHHWRNVHGDAYPRYLPEDVAKIADNILRYQRVDGGWIENQDPARILVCLLDLIKAEQLSPLVEDGGFGGVQVLGRAIPQHSATEADDPATFVPDRKHDAIAETIVAARAAVTGDQHTARNQQLFVIPTGAKAATHLIPVPRGITDVEALDHLASQAPAFQILHRLRRVLEIALVEARNLVHQLEQILADGWLAMA